MIARGTGYIRDRAKRPGEAHDWSFAEHAPRIRAARPATATAPSDWRSAGFILIYDQGGLGTCVTFGIGGAWQAQQRFEGLPQPEKPSSLAIYRARLMEGTIAYDAGLQIRDAYDWVRQRGVMRERHFPYTDGPGWNKDLPPDLDRYAIDQSRAHSDLQYARIYETGDKLQEQLDEADAIGVPVVFGSDVSKQFCACAFDPTEPYDPSRGGGGSEGGHCQWIVPGGRRVEKDGTVSRLVANSWGADVLDRGFWRMAESTRLDDVHAQLGVPRYSDQL